MYYIWPLLIETQLKEKLQREVMADLIIRPPDYVVVVNVDNSLGVKTDADKQYIQKLFQLFAHYRLIGVIGDDSESLFIGSDDEMRTVAGEGVTMLLLGRSDDKFKGLTFGALLGWKGL